MKRRFWAGLLPFVMLWSLLPVSALAAEEGTPEPDTGLSFVKTVAPEGEDGTYKITMEAYAKGETVSVSKTEPCDIVLVLDVSGSMDDEFSNDVLKGYTEIRYKAKKNQTRPATNQELLDEYTRNKEVYYKAADGNYQKVTVARAVGEPTYVSAGSFTYRDAQNNSGKYFAQKYGETGYLSVKIQDDGWSDYKLYIGDKSFEIPKGKLGIRVNVDDKQIATATSSSEGYAVFSLDERDYNKLCTKDEIYYTELTAPEGYVLDSAEHKIKAKDFSDSLSTAVKNADTVQNYRGTTPDLLNDSDHFAYVIGYKDGNVRPYGLISRAETTTIFFRLLKDSVRDGNLLTSNTYTDVPDNYWANTAISTMTGLGIVQGRSTTTFDPKAPITRAQFAAICARFDTGKSSGTQSFTDIKGHWAEKYIERAAELGWIKGFEDGTFRPDTYITRAQAMTMINRVLNRIPEENGDLLSSMNVWPDCNPGDWFYLAVQEATNSHDYKHKAGNYETWTSMNKDPNWTRYEN